MSNAFAIGAVTAVIKNLLDNATVHEPLVTSVGSVKVTAISPDQIKLDATDYVRINLFLYHVEPNAAWANAALPSRDVRGDRLVNAPLALNLYYLVSAYGKQDFEAEVLLGYAAQLLHEVPVLTRESIRKTFEAAVPLPTLLEKIATAKLADQIELVKITPVNMNAEEMSKLWAALQTPYRPSIAYVASVVLIEAGRPSRTPMPVLMRGDADRGVVTQPSLVPPFPTLTNAVPPNKQPAILLAQTLTLEGYDLSGSNVQVRFEPPMLGTPIVVAAAGGSNATKILVSIPNAPADWPAGVWKAAAVVTRTGEPARTSNTIAFALAPAIVTKIVGPDEVLDTDITRPAGVLTIKLKVRPQVLPQQKVSLIVGERELVAEPRATKTADLTFLATGVNAPPPGEYAVRLRVDGIESQLIDRSKKPPQFDPMQKVTLP